MANAITMEDFFTREKSNEGIIVPLGLPDGTPTEHGLRYEELTLTHSERPRQNQSEN